MTRVPARTGDQVIMVGDSITAVVLYYQALASSIAGAFIGGQAPAPSFVNTGINGAKVSTYNDPSVRTSNLAPYFNAVGPMIIFLGVNDEFQAPPTSDNQFRSDYCSLMSYITTNFTSLRGIVLMSPWLIGNAPRGAGPNDAGLDRKTAIVAKVANMFGVGFLNMRDLWFNGVNHPTDVTPLVDQVHPNGVGTVWLCEQVRAAIEVRY